MQTPWFEVSDHCGAQCGTALFEFHPKHIKAILQMKHKLRKCLCVNLYKHTSERPFDLRIVPGIFDMAVQESHIFVASPLFSHFSAINLWSDFLARFLDASLTLRHGTCCVTASRIIIFIFIIIIIHLSTKFVMLHAGTIIIIISHPM